MKIITKNKIQLKTLFVCFLYLITTNSCDQDDFLKEVPLDFYSPENAFITNEDFQSAVMHLYGQYRADFWDDSGSGGVYSVWQFTDLVHGTSSAGLMNHAGNLTSQSSTVYEYFWKRAYRIIYDANTIIERSEAQESELTDEQKKLIQAEAMFFRGYMYKLLANMYGGVPITLEETKEPKRDYVRASREETYLQAATDLKFAADNLPDINEVDNTRINNLAAFHYLSEVYISLEQWPNAIDAASMVIDHPSTALMTERFGTDVDPERNRFPAPFNDTIYGGDVFWDLFRPGNQNRSAGNTEAIWVMQYAVDIPGGSGSRGGFPLERQACPRVYQTSIINDNGTLHPVAPHPNTYLTGRGIGGMRPTNFFLRELWERSGFDQDIRNSKYNIVRDMPVMNPESDHYGKWVFRDNVPIVLESEADTTRSWYPYLAKTTTVGKHPEFLYLPDQTVPGSLTSRARDTYRENYIIRLAETYLLRAEAYLGQNDLINAAADINVVRHRAHAPDVNPSDVNIDYILDERLRELAFEEYRSVTLRRLGLLVERCKKYNPLIQYQDYHNLYPIPFSEIEKNTGSVLEQNPGYF
ncbi:RagB/SusD family nutrient uptake outer membrane protein [Membranihabitans maritimus]|uniref:RagB/SusD family nutrient uptake outer membrane protein n=1 Tax=Membranihabitans maritimus TaxID=2904244 RepID=UPI001F38E116|nr:RagB/SusD family nutrient uptake outer membrane protein [Membranihabitans maritimus]